MPTKQQSQHHSDQISEMRSKVAALESTKCVLEAETTKQAEICHRLRDANDKLSQNALSMAEDSQQEKKSMQLKLEGRIAELQRKLDASEEDMEEMRTR
jgi:predicted RNase H-like nuclease (RuvC/YqgF family)